MLRSRRIPLFEREVHVRLSPAAAELLWLNTSVMSEGEIADGVYCGSTMLTLDLARVSSQLSDACDQAGADLLERVMVGDHCLRERALALARECAEDRAGGPLRDVGGQVRIARKGRHFHIDVDIEGTVTEAP